MRSLRMLLTALCAGLVLISVVSIGAAADHGDVTTPAADIGGVYAWMEDPTRLVLAMTIHPDAAADATFSDAVLYAFHVDSYTEYSGEAQHALVVCQFYDPQGIECWLGDEYLVGDPSDPEGVSSASGGLRVFAGLRDDPCFFELDGLGDALGAMRAVAPDVDADAFGCPDVGDLDATFIGLMQGVANDDGQPQDSFAGQNVLALVVELDVSLVDAGGPLLGVWASTNEPSQ